jgi:uncharacterized protein
MQSTITAQWRKLDGTPVGPTISAAVERALLTEADLGNRIKVCIGTDSQVYGRDVDFATVVLLHRRGKGGYMYIASERTAQRMTLKERMLLEVSRSIEVAYHLCPLFDLYKTELEVHADINTNPRFGSNTALSEAMGYILSMGFTFKAKPDAIAASCCANKVV